MSNIHPGISSLSPQTTTPLTHNKMNFNQVSSKMNHVCPGKAHWSIDDIPDLQGKVIIVTGGNSGK